MSAVGTQMSMKVLLADDDRDQLTLRSLLLERSGFETLRALDSASAAELAETEKPECAVVDLRLPTEELGLKLICDLKRLNPAIHIVVITGGNPERLAQQPASNLIDEVVVKGAPSALLIEKLRSIALELSSSG
jgi:CheY-like chemotaxis protein